MARSHQVAAGLGGAVRADARPSAARKSLSGRTAALAAALFAALLAACGGPAPPTPETPAAAPSQTAPAPPSQAKPAGPERPLSPLDRYKREVARAILKANAANTFEGVPPHFLRAVIVLQLTVDAKGAITGVKTLRTRDADLAVAATKSAHAAAPLPAPPRELLRSGRLEYVETWLYRDDGRFQVRSLADPQAAVVD